LLIHITLLAFERLTRRQEEGDAVVGGYVEELTKPTQSAE